MAIVIRNQRQILEREVTPQSVYVNRRKFLKISAVAATSGLVGLNGEALATGRKLDNVTRNADFVTDEEQTTYEDATTYNNFYEFGTGKDDPAKNAHTLKTRPWKVAVEGQCAKPGSYDIEDILKWMKLEERIYRFRCVEAWSMVLPWVGFPLGDLIKRLEPHAAAKYVEFETLLDPETMPGQQRAVLEWPYREGLRMDEAMHPLTLMAVGMYGEVLPNQNGAPMRLVVPWKYGFKSIKSIVRINFRESQPRTSWNDAAPREYGFYSNVNPTVNHPRWSQGKERRISGERSLLESLFSNRIPTQLHNGYADQVAALYAGMDPFKYY